MKKGSKVLAVFMWMSPNLVVNKVLFQGIKYNNLDTVC